ncbi:MAG: hypothetical protein Ct9H300mP28_00950 [Pseudomonadota bacterium]|nr:MAG: hypothetical protein Ct9H300mP28_00950 [Pseudomonadota bacterium]
MKPPGRGRMDGSIWSPGGNTSGKFMGMPRRGKRVEIRYMDFWKVSNGKIVDNWVMVDFPTLCPKLGGAPLSMDLAGKFMTVVGNKNFLKLYFFLKQIKTLILKILRS